MIFAIEGLISRSFWIATASKRRIEEKRSTVKKKFPHSQYRPQLHRSFTLNTHLYPIAIRPEGNLINSHVLCSIRKFYSESVATFHYMKHDHLTLLLIWFEFIYLA